MLTSVELRKQMVKCLANVEVFSTAELREMLKGLGCTYNIDYEENAFSNAISFLAKKKVIISEGKEKKGMYRVSSDTGNGAIYKNTAMNTAPKAIAGSKAKVREEECDKEPELKEMREKIKECLKADCEKIEQILDSEKPSKFGRNRRTYDDILDIIEYMKNFKFRVEE